MLFFTFTGTEMGIQAKYGGHHFLQYRDQIMYASMIIFLSLGIFHLNESDAVSLQHNPTQLFLRVFLHVNLCSLVQYQIHIFVKTWSEEYYELARVNDKLNLPTICPSILVLTFS